MDKTYYIHDNGDRPFKVVVKKEELHAYVYKGEEDYKELILETKYKKIFIGESYEDEEDEEGNTILIYVGKCKYIYIGMEIYSFTVDKGKDNVITEYYSPIGNNDVPYPYAVSKNNTYLMLDEAIIDNKYIDHDEYYGIDVYNLYYGHYKDEDEDDIEDNNEDEEIKSTKLYTNTICKRQ